LSQRRDSFPGAVSSQVRVAHLSLEDTEAIERLLDAEQPDVVVHLASTLVPASDVAAYLEERRTVLEPTLRLLLRLAERRLPVVFFSSGGAIYGPSAESALNEESTCRPISFYGQGKLELEELIRFLGRTANLPYLIVRPSNPFGGSQVLNGRQGLIAAVLGCVRDNRTLRIWGDGQVVRDYIYIDDLCTAVTHLITERTAGTVNMGSGIGHSALDVIRMVEQIVARSVLVEFAPARAVDVPRIVLDVSRAAGLGVPSARPLTDGIRQFAADLGLVNA
jgi:UDP-glucose 4-epimerase